MFLKNKKSDENKIFVLKLPNPKHIANPIILSLYDKVGKQLSLSLDCPVKRGKKLLIPVPLALIFISNNFLIFNFNFEEYNLRIKISN